LLDTRCGTRRLTKEFSEIGWDVTGFDASGEMIAKAQHLHSGAKTTARFFTADDLTEVDVPDAEFDLIVAFDDMATELVDPNLLSRLLDLSFRCLTIGGHLIFQTGTGRGSATNSHPGRDSTCRRRGGLASISVALGRARRHGASGVARHLRSPTRPLSEWTELLRQRLGQLPHVGFELNRLLKIAV
jgi:hypothetical protein